MKALKAKSIKMFFSDFLNTALSLRSQLGDTLLKREDVGRAFDIALKRVPLGATKRDCPVIYTPSSISLSQH